MAKITDLLVATALTGEETLPIVQGTATKRVTMAAFRALIVPFLQQWYKGDPGNPGPAGNVAITLAQLRAAPITNGTMIAAYDGSGSTMTWTEGDFTALAARWPMNYEKANAQPLTSGAWVRQAASAILFDGRSADAKLREIASVTDPRFGSAVGDNATPALPAFSAAAAALVDGGALDIPAGIYKVGEQPLGPSRGNVHAYDLPVIGTTSVVTNPGLVGATTTGWTLINMASANPGVTHAAGSIAKLRRSITVAGYTTYLIRLKLLTTAAGCTAFFIDGKPVFDEADPVTMPVGDSYTHSFAYFSADTVGDVTFELRSDDAWGGKIELVDMIRVEAEAPYDFHSIPADTRSFKNPHGLKFGRHMAGNMMIGDRQTGALLGYDASWTIAIGARTLSTNVGGEECTGVGAFALQYNSAKHLVAYGYSALKYNLTGQHNTGIGYKALLRNTEGSRNTGVGYTAGYYGTYGSQNTSVGYQAHYYASTGNLNVALGAQAGLTNGRGSQNVYVGGLAGSLGNQIRVYHYDQTTSVGCEAKCYGSRTLAIGFQAQCGSDPEAGGRAIEQSAIAIGDGALVNADESVAIGPAASVPATTSFRSTVIGKDSLATGHDAVATGYRAKAGDMSAAYGAQSSADHTNALAMGYGAISNRDNQATIGNAGMDELRAPTATITTISDRRDKTNIRTIDPDFALQVIARLLPSRWDWAMRGEMRRTGGDTGFIAQDLDGMQQLLDAAWLGLVNTSDPNRFEATPGKLIPVLVAALQGAARRADASDAALQGALERIAVLENARA